MLGKEVNVYKNYHVKSITIKLRLSSENKKCFLEFAALLCVSARRRLMVKEFKMKLYRDMNRIMCHQYTRKNSLQMKVFTKTGNKFNYE